MTNNSNTDNNVQSEETFLGLTDSQWSESIKRWMEKRKNMSPAERREAEEEAEAVMSLFD